MINSPKVNIITLEDPVEYQMNGVNQVQVNPQAGLTFASGLRSFLRQDPNIIMVGEIRDEETTQLAIQASLTGHLVFSTVHTNSSSGALPRLLDMGAEPFLLASSMTAAIGQRVLRKICDNCKSAYVPEQTVVDDVQQVLGKMFDGWLKSNPEKSAQASKNKAPFMLYKGAGCEKCGNSGYFGRIGIYEVLRVTEKIARLILERADAATIEKQAMEDGMIIMKQDGYLKVLEGISTLEEVIRVAQV
jgi:type IV pilus assembly protein PilB